jgi:hypothetical protein
MAKANIPKNRCTHAVPHRWYALRITSVSECEKNRYPAAASSARSSR